MSQLEECYFIKWHSNHCTPLLPPPQTAHLLLDSKSPTQVELPTFIYMLKLKIFQTVQRPEYL